MSQSRQGAARSAAILLYSYHLNALKDHTSPSLYQTPYHSNDLMARYIEQQLEDQKKLLYLDIPTLRNHNSLMRKLHLNPRSELDLSDVGNSPLHKRIQQRFFCQSTSSPATKDVDERSGVEELFVNKSTEACDLNGSSQSNTHNVSFITDGGYTNPLAYNIDDLDDASDTSDSDSDAYQRSLIIDNREFFLGAMPTPVSEGPASIAV